MKKFIMKTALVAVLGLSMVSCKSTFYQVYDVDYDSNMKMQDNSLVYENEDCKVLYNLWSEGGFVKFAIINGIDSSRFPYAGEMPDEDDRVWGCNLNCVKACS